MPSYQEIETRLAVVEDKIEFIMKTMRMKAAVPNGLFKADGTPDYNIQDGSMLDWYLLSRQLPTELQSEGAPNPAEEAIS